MNANYCFIILMGALLPSFSNAQTSAIPPAGYVNKIDGAIPGRQVYMSNQRPFNAQGELVGAGDLTAQTQQVFENLKTALSSVGLTLRDVTQVTYHIKGVTTQPSQAASNQVNSVGAAYFAGRMPGIADIKSVAKTTRDDVLVEIEVIAVK